MPPARLKKITLKYDAAPAVQQGIMSSGFALGLRTLVAMEASTSAKRKKHTMSNRFQRLSSFVAAFTVVMGMFAVTALAKRAETGEALPPKPAATAIESLQLEPSSLTLSDGRDGRQVLVWGVTKDGQKIDLSDEATYKVDAAFISVADGRYLNPLRAGKTSVTVSAAGKTSDLPVEVLSVGRPEMRFAKDVMPILASVGCNAGTCHGSAKGKNGFKLSLRGYDSDNDYNALVTDLLGRRIDKVRPERSLMLLKPAGVVPHEGGKALSPGSRQYEAIVQWIREGVHEEPDLATARPNQLEVLPSHVDLDLPGRSQRLVVIAKYPDGTSRDVTRDAVITSSKDEVAKVAGPVLTGIRRGEAAVLVRYEGNYAAVNVSVMGDRAGFAWSPQAEFNFIDKHVNTKLLKRKTLPAEECTDAEFVRRAYVDVTGLIPTSAQARAFLEDTTPSRQKRESLAAKLIGGKEYVDNWSNKWADLLQCNTKALGPEAVWAFREWIREEIAQNKPYDQFVYEIVTAQGSSLTHPAVNFYRALRDKDDNGKATPNKMGEDITQTFLGVRFNCNKCHDHPFERWTQKQYYEFGAFFARVNFKAGPHAGEEIVFADYRGGENLQPKTQAIAAPHVPYGKQPDVDSAHYRQEAFGRWLTAKENPLFARSFVNRTWSYYFGIGIIDPADDIRASNPPSNPELLDALTEDFIQSGFDVQHLMKTIVTSRTYQSSVKTNRWNEDDKLNFSHFLPRRLSAEQVMDCVAIATGTRPRVAGLPDGMRSIYLADGLADANDFLKLFGRPKRETACECERSSNLSLAHALSLVNGPIISEAVSDPGNNIATLLTKFKDNRQVIEELYLSILGRLPSDNEVQNSGLGGDPARRLEETQDLAWALLNGPAFLFNR